MHYNYRPARLVQSKSWYVEYYQLDLKTGKLKRYRESLNLNRIKDLDQRLIIANRRVVDLNTNLLPSGYPNDKLKVNIKLTEALKIAFKAKHSSRANTNKTYNTLRLRLDKFIIKHKMINFNVMQFTKMHAYAFMDEIANAGLSGVTYNNYKTHGCIIFKQLKDRGYILSNPFEGMSNKKEEAKRRQPLSRIQKALLIEAIQDQKESLLLPVQLIYYCFIRPKELTMLRVGDINIIDNIITMRGEITKNRLTEHVTVPDNIMKILANHIEGCSFRDYVFSSIDLVPGKKMISRDFISKQHKKIVDSLKKEIDIQGVTLYSWKDTGASDMLKHGINIEALRRQLRHRDLNTTQRYLTGFSSTNENIKNIPNLITIL